MRDSVKLSIVNKKRLTHYYVFGLIICLALLTLFLSIFYFDSAIIKKIALIVIAVFGLMNLFTKSYTLSGFLCLYSDHMEIQCNKLNMTINIQDLKKVKLIYRGYEGEVRLYIKSFAFRDGTDNFIEFTYKEVKYSFEVFLKKRDLLIVRKILSQWDFANSTR